jgi:hypothetical protein
MILDIYKPEQNYGTPTGGTSLIAFNGAWSGLNATSVILDSDPLNLGNLEPQLSTYKASEQFGEITRSYTHSDRDMSFKIQITGNTFNDLKNAVQALQTVISEATQYALNDGQTIFNQTSIGFPLMLKYQPDSSVEAHYFIIKHGGIDTSTFNDNIKNLSNRADIQIKLKTTYAAYGDANYIYNVLSNGSGHHGFQYWTPSDGKVSARSEINPSLTLKVWSAMAENAGNPGAPVAMDLLASPMGTDPLFGNLTLPTDSPTYFRWENSGAVNTGAECFDSYTRADNASTAGNLETPSSSAYTAVVGTWGTRSNTLYCVSDNNGDKLIFTQANENIFSAKVKYGYADVLHYRGFGLLHRYLDSSNYAYLWSPTGTNWQLTTVVAGISTNRTIVGNPTSATGITSSPAAVLTNIKIISVGNWSYYFYTDPTRVAYGDIWIGAFDFSTTPTLYASGANKLGFINIKVSTPSTSLLAYADDLVVTNIVTLTSDWIYKPLNGPTANNKFWLALEYRINGSGADSAFTTASVEYFQSSAPGTIVQLGPTQNLGGSTSNTWARNSWPSAQSLGTSITSDLSIRVKFTTNITKVGTASIDIRKISLLAFPGYLPSQFVKLPSTEYVHQSLACAESCIVTGIAGNVETNVKLSLLSPGINTNVYQQIDLGVRRQTGIPGPFVLDYGNASLVLNKAGSNYSNSVNTNYTTNTSYPFSDFIARTYKLILIGNFFTPCGVGFASSNTYSGTSQRPYFSAVPNAYLTELPVTSSQQAIDCGLITIPPYDVNSSAVHTNNWNIILTATANTGVGTFTNYISKAIFLPADQFTWLDTREAAGELAWTNPSKALVLDSLLKETTSYYLDDLSSNQILHFNPNGSQTPIRLYPATLTNPSPMMFAVMIRRSGTAGAPNTNITVTDPVLFSLFYCPAYII